MARADERRELGGIADPRSWLLAVLQSANDGILGATLDGRISSVNPAGCRVFGYTPVEFLERSLSDVTESSRVIELGEALDRLRRGEQIGHYRTVLIRKRGEAFPASLALSSVAADDGNIVGLSAVVRDLSAEREAEEKRRLLEALVQSSPDAIYSRSLDGIITSWNPGAASLFGYSRDEIVARPVRTLVPPETENELGDFTRKITRGEVIQEYETIRLTKDGRRIPVSLTLFPIRDETGAVTGIGSVARDMARDDALQESYRKLNALSPRERDVMGLLADGLSNREISVRLRLSVQTVKNYVSRILLKLGAASRAQAAAEFLSFRSFLGEPSTSHQPRLRGT